MSVRRLEGNTDKHCRKWEIRYRIRCGNGYLKKSKAFKGTKKGAKAEEKRLKAMGRPTSTPVRGKPSEVSGTWVLGRESAGKITDVTALKQLDHVNRVVREIDDREVSKATRKTLQSMFSSIDCSPEHTTNIRATLHTCSATSVTSRTRARPGHAPQAPIGKADRQRGRASLHLVDSDR